ncbi:cytochrome P450 [Xylariaceae sp. FL1272]|nr:cytochrome P450 [Xylariaceae sp. FL1272]
MLKLLLLVVITVLLTWAYSRLSYHRFKQYAYFPQVQSNLIWGHLKAMGELTRQAKPAAHVDMIFEQMWSSIGRPPVMLVDLRPLSAPLALITSHEVAEQITKSTKDFPTSAPKSSTADYMDPMIGSTSMLRISGNHWKESRKMYNPGFSPKFLSSLLPLILEEMKPFLSYLDQYAASGESFSLDHLLANLTFDIIGAAVMGVGLQAQDPSNRGELVKKFEALGQTFWGDTVNFPWWLAPIVTAKRTRLSRQLNHLVDDIIKQQYHKAKRDTHQVESIMSLGFKDAESLTPDLLSNISDQVKTFLFAGQDTNSTTLQWAFYELSRTPRARKAICEELDAILGPERNPYKICKLIAREKESVFPRMHYVNAVIKETLRLHPPAGTARMTTPGTGFTVHTPTGEEYCLDGLVMYMPQSIIHRNPEVFGDNADHWIPERWLDDNKYPPGSYRPFERGPRNCIGVELANLEARIIIAVVTRNYEFTKIGLGASALDEKGLPMLNEHGQCEVESNLYNTRRITAKPVDATVMKVKISKQ